MKGTDRTKRTPGWTLLLSIAGAAVFGVVLFCGAAASRTSVRGRQITELIADCTAGSATARDAARFHLAKYSDDADWAALEQIARSLPWIWMQREETKVDLCVEYIESRGSAALGAIERAVRSNETALHAAVRCAATSRLKAGSEADAQFLAVRTRLQLLARSHDDAIAESARAVLVYVE